MTPQRLKKLQGNLFVVLIISIIIFIYFCNVKLIWCDLRPNTFWVYAYLVLFNFLAFMVAWCLLTTMFTDPGRVPQNWGYFLEDPEQKKRRYCLICHIFKPERTHHCSACNRCVLNMDHHCPWLGNCVGFANRKYFLLLLFYVNLTTWVAAFGMVYEIFNIFITVSNKLGGDDSVKVYWFSDFLIIVAFCIDVTAIVVIGIFFKFHLELLFINTTTLENLDRKRSSPGQSFNQYDMGPYYNFLSVFGSNRIYWPFPFLFGDARPSGDGVIWPHRRNEQEVNQNNNSSEALKSSPAPTTTNNTSFANTRNTHTSLPYTNNTDPRFRQPVAYNGSQQGQQQQQQQNHQVYQQQQQQQQQQLGYNNGYSNQQQPPYYRQQQ